MSRLSRHFVSVKTLIGASDAKTGLRTPPREAPSHPRTSSANVSAAAPTVRFAADNMEV
jgi:hypothetical protein